MKCSCLGEAMGKRSVPIIVRVASLLLKSNSLAAWYVLITTLILIQCTRKHKMLKTLYSVFPTWNKWNVFCLRIIFDPECIFNVYRFSQEDLFRLLKAYTIHNPSEGYCQAQAPIAAVLLMHMPCEEAFWCFVSICEKYLPGYYSPGLVSGFLYNVQWNLSTLDAPRTRQNVYRDMH